MELKGLEEGDNLLLTRITVTNQQNGKKVYNLKKQQLDDDKKK